MTEKRINPKIDLILKALETKVDKSYLNETASKIGKRINLVNKKINSLEDSIYSLSKNMNNTNKILKKLTDNFNKLWVNQVEMDKKINVLIDAAANYDDRISRHENIISIHSNKLENIDVRLKVLETSQKD